MKRKMKSEKQIVLAFQYYFGNEVEKNEKKSEKLTISSAKLGNKTANGMLHYLGWGEKRKDENQALEMFLEVFEKDKQVVNKDTSCAIFMLARIYNIGKKPNLEKSVFYYQIAIKLGNSSAMNNLAFIYHHGEKSIRVDLKKALDLYERAVLLGNSNAMYHLGMLYKRGEQFVFFNFFNFLFILLSLFFIFYLFFILLLSLF